MKEIKSCWNRWMRHLCLCQNRVNWTTFYHHSPGRAVDMAIKPVSTTDQQSTINIHVKNPKFMIVINMKYPTELISSSRGSVSQKTILKLNNSTDHEVLLFMPTEPYTVACIAHTSTLWTSLWYPRGNNKSSNLYIGGVDNDCEFIS